MWLFFFKGEKRGIKKKKGMSPCKQNREKGIVVVTIIIKPQTHKIHKLDWGGFGNAVSYQRGRLFWTFCTDRAEQEPKQTSPTAVTRLGSRERQHGPLRHRGCESSQVPCGSSRRVRRWGWRVLAAPSAKHVHHWTNFWMDFYKYIQISYRHLKCLWLE